MLPCPTFAALALASTLACRAQETPEPFREGPEPLVFTRGVIHEGDDQDLLDDAGRAVRRAVSRVKSASDDQTLRDAAGRAVRRVFRDAMGWRPLVHVLLHGARR